MSMSTTLRFELNTGNNMKDAFLKQQERIQVKVNKPVSNFLRYIFQERQRKRERMRESESDRQEEEKTHQLYANRVVIGYVSCVCFWI